MALFQKAPEMGWSAIFELRIRNQKKQECQTPSIQSEGKRNLASETSEASTLAVNYSGAEQNLMKVLRG
jgi:hypothetical protein